MGHQTKKAALVTDPTCMQHNRNPRVGADVANKRGPFTDSMMQRSVASAQRNVVQTDAAATGPSTCMQRLELQAQPPLHYDMLCRPTLVPVGEVVDTVAKPNARCREWWHVA
jgi:hypothetical protein